MRLREDDVTCRGEGRSFLASPHTPVPITCHPPPSFPRMVKAGTRGKAHAAALCVKEALSLRGARRPLPLTALALTLPGLPGIVVLQNDAGVDGEEEG